MIPRPPAPAHGRPARPRPAKPAMPALRLTLLLLLAYAPDGNAAVAAAMPACHRGAAATRLAQALTTVRFATYEPTSLQVVGGQPTRADPDSLRADLDVLRTRFDGLITYESGHGMRALPPLAAERGFSALILGIWNPADAGEVDEALAAARAWPDLVVGFALGNEVLFDHRLDAQRLTAAIAGLRARVPGVALAASEPFHLFYGAQAAPLLASLDFMLPNVHPIFQPWFPGAPARQSADFVAQVVTQLEAVFCGPILVKETGLPSAPAERGFDAARQALFWRALREQLPPTRRHAFAWFAAFDAPWRAREVDARGRAHEEEAHFGLFDAQRRPKPASEATPLLRPSG